ncbi:MAG: PH domain leucine-rich repeat-containing protein phosphatase 2 [Stictis urceolatum]|nr:PH domain leucine-rich repeat-containing protein phosphatase 2 [Stictis urceolata]
MQFSNTLSLAVAILASSAIALPFPNPGQSNGGATGGAGAAGSKCSEEGKVACNNKQFQVCASGNWSVSMSLARGTDCSVFGTGNIGGSGSLPPNPSTIPVSPVPAAIGGSSSTPSIPIPTAAPSTPPTPSTAADSSSSDSDAGPTGGFAGHQSYSQPSFPVPTKASSSVAAPKLTSASTTTQPTGGSSSEGSNTPQPSQHYIGGEDAYPHEDKWVSFDTMWNLNSKVCDGPQNDGKGDLIKQDIQKVAGESGIDARVILAVILQESTCLLGVASTNGGVNNPGIMQSHNGVSFDGSDSSILQMIKDGVQGTGGDGGDGIMQYIKQYGLYTGLRAYNSGPNGINKSNLEALPAGTGTASYCNDIANRLTGAKVESQ